MNIKTKGLFKVLVIALSMLFAVALAFGISGAWYNTTREAKGTLSMAKGIVIDYSGFNQGADVWEDNASFNLFASQNGMLPGQSVALYNTKIKANASSIDFYARAKLEYKFFTDVEGLTDVTSQIADYSAFINTPTFAQGWVDGRNGDGWFYYATGATFNTIPSADYVDIFAPGQSLTLNIDAPGFNHQGGGYQYSNEILIKRITVTLTLNALQANTAAAEFNGWEIVPQYTDAAGVVYTQNNDETWTLTDGTALSGNSSSSTATYEARMYDSTYSYTVLSQINNQNVVAIGDEAFLNASQLTSVTIPSTVSTIGVRAFEGTGLNAITLPENVTSVGANALNTNSLSEVTIENEDSVITGIALSGIPTASTINVPAAVSGNYEVLLPSNNVVAAAAPQQGLTLNAVASDNLEYGAYMATDSDGNKWYFDFGTLSQDGLTWTQDNTNGIQVMVDRCELANPNVNNQTIIIPSFASVNELSNNYPIVGITGFLNLDAGFTMGIFSPDEDCYVSTIIVPDTVIIIKDYAFSPGMDLGLYGPQLTTIVLPDSLKVIGDSAFAYCGNLTNINFPSGLLSIGRNAFDGCISLTSITIPDSVTSIENSAFSSCTGLTLFSGENEKYTISSDGKCLIENDGLTHTLIAFAGAGVSTYTEIPNSVTNIGYSAFSGCTNLTSITIPNSVTSISNAAFSGFTSLTTVVINANITSVPSSCFRWSTNLTNLTLPVSVTTIGEWAFNGCNNLTSINWSASYNLGAEKNNEVVTLAKATTGLTIGDINLPDGADLVAAGVTAPTGKVFAGWTDGTNTYTTTAPIATVRAGLTAVWDNE